MLLHLIVVCVKCYQCNNEKNGVSVYVRLIGRTWSGVPPSSLAVSETRGPRFTSPGSESRRLRRLGGKGLFRSLAKVKTLSFQYSNPTFAHMRVSSLSGVCDGPGQGISVYPFRSVSPSTKENLCIICFLCLPPLYFIVLLLST